MDPSIWTTGLQYGCDAIKDDIGSRLSFNDLVCAINDQNDHWFMIIIIAPREARSGGHGGIYMVNPKYYVHDGMYKGVLKFVADVVKCQDNVNIQPDIILSGCRRGTTTTV